MTVDSRDSTCCTWSFFRSRAFWICLPFGYAGLFCALKCTTSLSLGWLILITVLLGDVPGMLLALLIVGVGRLVNRKGAKVRNTFLIIIMLLAAGCARKTPTAGEPLLVIRLPDGVTETFPPPPGLAGALRAIGPALSREDAPLRMAVVSRSAAAVDCGIIAIQALGRKTDRATRARKIKDIRSLKVSSIIAIGSYSPQEIRMLGNIAPTQLVDMDEQAPWRPDAPVHAVVVLGNEPLDRITPTVDTLARVKRAVDYRTEHPGSILIFTGGKTAGSVSEAWMMAVVALVSGVPAEAIILEKDARSTSENAWFGSEMVEELRPVRVVILTSESHMEWALPIFRKYDVFADAIPVTSYVTRQARMQQMREYLKGNDSARVRQRLEWLSSDTRGVD